MRRALAPSLVLAIVVLAPTAIAHSFVSSSHLVFGHPDTVPGGDVSQAAACDPGGELDGIDGEWYDLTITYSGSPDPAGHAYELDPAVTLDTYPFFHTEDCELIGDGDRPAGFHMGVAETGTIPEGTAYVYVDGWAGSGAFGFVMEHPT